MRESLSERLRRWADVTLIAGHARRQFDALATQAAEQEQALERVRARCANITERADKAAQTPWANPVGNVRHQARADLADAILALLTPPTDSAQGDTDEGGE